MYQQRNGRARPTNNRFQKRGGRSNFRQPSFHPSNFISSSVAAPVQQQEAPKVAISTLPVDKNLLQNAMSKGYEFLTPIQEKAIGPILAGKNVVGVANTGTGKTAAFLIPLLHKVLNNRSERVIIILPTRELAMQIQTELRTLTQRMGIYSALCIGGSAMGRQIQDVRRNPQFIIGTPGRLKDLIERRILNISAFKSIVLDEVDRMLDMGFVHDVRALIALLPQQRQSLFFSATLSPEIRSLIQTFAPDHIMVSVATTQTTSHIEQGIIRANAEGKFNKLHDLLKNEEFKKVLVFVRTKFGAERLSKNLFKLGIKTTSIHGNKSQWQRTQAIRMFSENVIHVLVATDVASRGIDIHDITHVINYDPPATREDYIHRIGRTGRANKKGTALTFVD